MGQSITFISMVSYVINGVILVSGWARFSKNHVGEWGLELKSVGVLCSLPRSRLLQPTWSTYRAATEDIKLASSSQLPEERGKREVRVLYTLGIGIKGGSQALWWPVIPREAQATCDLRHVILSSSKAWPRECQALIHRICCPLPHMGMTAGAFAPCSPLMAGNSKSCPLWKHEQGW